MRKILVALLALSLVLLAACSSNSKKPDDTTPPKTDTPAPAPAPAQKITLALSGEPATLDPHKSFNGNVFTVTNQIYESLLSRNPDGTLSGRLATEYKSVNPTTWELKLRQNVKFSDGTPFNAAAVKFSLERLKDPATKAPGGYIVTMIKEIKVVDDHTVQLITDKPFAPLPAHLSHPVAAMVSPEGAKKDLGKEPIGTGPFTLKEWKAGESVTLVANPNYWGGKPKLDTVLVRVIPEAGTQITELKAGTVDFVNGVQAEKWAELSADKKFAVTRFPGWGSYYIGFNMKQGPLAKLEVRQAIAKALDRKAMVETLRMGMAMEAAAPIPKTVFGSSMKLAPIAYNVAEAKELMKKAGVTTPLKIKLHTYEGAENKQIAGAIQAQLKEIGIDLEIQVTDFGAYSTETAKPDHGMFLTSWGTVTMDADYAFYAWYHSGQHAADNKAFYADPEVDKWLDEGRSNPDQAARLAAYEKIQQRVNEQLPYLTLYWPLSSYAKNARLQGEVYPFALINLDLRKAEVK